MFFDTHAHFDGIGGEENVRGAIRRATEAGVDKIIAVGGSAAGNSFAVQTAVRFPGILRAAIGYDREQARELVNGQSDIERMVSDLRDQIQGLIGGNTPIAAIGEIGLDFHYSADTAAPQIALFMEQLKLAGRLGLPVIVHSREAEDATLAELRRHRKAWRGGHDGIGVLHCFTGSTEFARQALELGFCISFSGIVTFGNASGVREAAGIVPDDRLLIETDSPYLAPAPHRGKRNEPAFLKHVAEALAEIRGASVARIAELTAANAERLFGRR